MTTLTQKAQHLAFEAHHGINNKHDGEPYVLHLHRVAIIVEADAGTDEEIAAAWLHDTIEDTHITFETIAQQVSYEVAVLVNALSKIKGESNESYYHRIKAHGPSATKIKLADLTDNFGRNHLIENDEKRLRMATKYSLGFDILRRPILK